MEVNVLDSNLLRSECIDQYESLIWTERWAGWGDFELTLRSTYENRALLRTGNKVILTRRYPSLITPTRAHRVMTVETIDDGTTDDGLDILKVKGTSLEAIFDDRTARPSTANLATSPTWDIVSPPAEIMRKVVHDICVTGVLNTADIIPKLVEARHPNIPASNVTEPIDPIGVKLDPQSVYEILTNLGNTWTLGFRLLLNLEDSMLYFDVYSGVDRTSSQTVYPAVVFSPELDNLKNTTEFQTIEGSKNVAAVIAKNGFMEVYPPDLPPGTAGFERRVLTVVADDIDLPNGADGSPEKAALDAAMLQRGKEALSEHRAQQAFDGEISQNSQYSFETDYFLGDLVEMRNTDGAGNKMRVTEQIFVSDKEGERSYPTLALNTFISTGSWLSYPADISWADYDPDTAKVWGVLP